MGITAAKMAARNSVVGWETSSSYSEAELCRALEGLLLSQGCQQRPWSLRLRGFYLQQQDISDAKCVGFPQQAILQFSADTNWCPVI